MPVAGLIVIPGVACQPEGIAPVTLPVAASIPTPPPATPVASVGALVPAPNQVEGAEPAIPGMIGVPK